MKKFVKKLVRSQGTCQPLHHVFCLCEPRPLLQSIGWKPRITKSAGEDSLLGILGVFHCMKPPSIETTMPSIADHGQMTQL